MWTTRRVREVVKREFKVEYHVDYLRRLMRKLGFTP
ncbi:winged helix-turn-helix domain-containing protein [Lignipirellula cremea]